MNTTSNGTARSSILRRLRGALPDQPLPAPDLQPFLDGPFGKGSKGPRPDPASLLDSFEAAARGWRAEVHHSTASQCMETVRRLLLARGCTRIATGTPLWNPPCWDAAFAGMTRLQCAQRTEDWKRDLFDTVDAGVTSAVAAIADTGSLVLIPGPHEPRSLSLVPPVHVALVRASTLYASLYAAMAALNPQAEMPTNLLLVTGPSKTADIQQTLAYGAHGPKELLIVLVDDVNAAPGAMP